MPRIAATALRDLQVGVAHGLADPQHTAAVDCDEMLSGLETFEQTLVGGVQKGRHNRGRTSHTVLIGAMERGEEVVTAVVRNLRKATLHLFVDGSVATGGVVHTGELKSRRGLGAAGCRHAIGNYCAKKQLSLRIVSPSVSNIHLLNCLYRRDFEHCPSQIKQHR